MFSLIPSSAGLVETTLEHVKQTHAQLSLETLGLVSKGGKKVITALEESLDGIMEGLFSCQVLYHYHHMCCTG